MILSQRFDWQSVSCDVTVGIDTETWTCPASIDDAYSALADLADWFGDAGRPWTATMEILWTRLGGEVFAAASNPRWEIEPSTAITLAWSTEAQAALETDSPSDRFGTGHGAMPSNGWGLSGSTTRGSMPGNASAQGTMRPGVPALAMIRPTAVAGFDYDGAELIAALLARTPSPRRCRVLDIDGTWRQYALSGVSRERRKTIWVHTLDLAGDTL